MTRAMSSTSFLSGLKTSRAALVRRSDQALKEIRNHVIFFLDHTPVTSESTEEHLEHLDALLDRLEKCNITLNLNKSHFFDNETKFLGHNLNTEGIKFDPGKNTRTTGIPTTEKCQEI